MKFMKYLFALVVVFTATASVSRANGTAVLTASGSSALFLELGQAAAVLPDTTCYWTHPKDTVSPVAARDTRPLPGNPQVDEVGNIWIAWGPGAGTCAAPVAPYNVYSDMSLDSVLGDKCFFMVDGGGVGGCIQILAVAASAPGQIPSLLGAGFTDTALPLDVINTVNNARMNAAATDIRPEDALFATARMFAPCGNPFVRNPYIQTSYQTYGLGYGLAATPNEGTPILDSFGNTFHVLNFHTAGADPFNGQALTAGQANYVVTTVGAQPIVVVVAPNDGALNRLANANDIMFSSLGEFFFGGYGRVSDLTGDTTDPDRPVVSLIREPLSGTYNVFEYSTVNSNQFKTSQDINNCITPGPTGTVNQNPLALPSADGFVPGAMRKRAIGTGQVVKALKAPGGVDTIGYFFWSAANAAGITTALGKYLTVAGVDPLQTSYTGGTLPGNSGVPLTNVTFANLAAGDYAIWSPLRIVSTPAAVPFVNAVIASAATAPATASDFIHVSNLKIWKSHFNMFGIGVSNNANGTTVATPNDLCSFGGAPVEGGGDAGAMTISIHGNNNFCNDFFTGIGINDKNN